MSEHMWQSLHDPHIPRCRDLLPDRTWITVVRSPSLLPETMRQHLLPLDKVSMEVQDDLVDIAVLSGDTATSQQLHLTGRGFELEDATCAIHFSQIKVLEYFHAHGLHMRTCPSPFDSVGGTSGLVREAIAEDSVAAITFLYSIGTKAEQWHLEGAQLAG